MDPFETRRTELEAAMGESLTVDGLSANFRIFQRARGHRHSTDDVLTAWYALEHAPPVSALLDLGTGIGTVGLLLVAALPDAHLTCIEAQDVSFALLTENVRANGLASRVAMHHGDLRDLALAPTFPLVTGSPPYFDVNAGIVPADPQKAHARFELRGNVNDYARAARRHLAPGGVFVFCFPWAQKSRAIRAAETNGFTVVAQRDVVPRDGLAPLFTVFACRVGDHPAVIEAPLVVRTREGRHTEAMHAVRARFGWGPQR